MRGDAARRARGHAPGMPTACLLGGNNLIFQKTLIFRKSLQICGQAAAKAMAKACIQGQGQGMQPRPRQPPMGMLPRLGHAAAKAKAAPMGRQRRPRHACVQQPRPRHAAKAMACLRGHAGMPLSASKWARWHALGRRQQQGPSMHTA